MTLRTAQLVAFSTALGAALAYASPAAAQDDMEPAPTEATPAPKPPDLPPPSARWSVAGTGLGIAAGWYGAALTASLIWSNGAWAPDMRIPVVGPWLAMNDFKCGAGEANCGTPLVVVRGILAGLDGVGQVGGLAIALESLFLPVRRSDHARRLEPRHAWVRPVPFLVGKDTIGLGIVGEL
jgi:hypothetical protein